MRIVDVREVTQPIASPIRNAYIDFTQDDREPGRRRHGRGARRQPVVGYGFNSNGRYGQGGLIRERFRAASWRPTPAACWTTRATTSTRPRSGRR